MDTFHEYTNLINLKDVYLALLIVFKGYLHLPSSRLEKDGTECEYVHVNTHVAEMAARSE